MKKRFADGKVHYFYLNISADWVEEARKVGWKPPKDWFQPVGCVAFEIKGDRIFYQVSVKNSKDKINFDRQIARSHALRRVRCAPLSTLLYDATSTFEVMILIMSSIINEYELKYEIPARVVRRAATWLILNCKEKS
jgi:hypothetical protein